MQSLDVWKGQELAGCFFGLDRCASAEGQCVRWVKAAW